MKINQMWVHIYLQIWVVLGVNVDKYTTLHGASGFGESKKITASRSWLVGFGTKTAPLDSHRTWPGTLPFRHFWASLVILPRGIPKKDPATLSLNDIDRKHVGVKLHENAKMHEHNTKQVAWRLTLEGHGNTKNGLAKDWPTHVAENHQKIQMAGDSPQTGRQLKSRWNREGSISITGWEVGYGWLLTQKKIHILAGLHVLFSHLGKIWGKSSKLTHLTYFSNAFGSTTS